MLTLFWRKESDGSYRVWNEYDPGDQFEILSSDAADTMFDFIEVSGFGNRLGIQLIECKEL